ncbi:DUF7007 domain-containing protein [Rhizobium tumorigenes]|uniref:DUF7007 domain-containing protein n=1 Tax=Rhizobium tumorigenes TaxID=2041385 RepID=UPI00241C0019|nr:hypothetical protein [Rhizobium tumorigenes]WFS03346.1 hypothetical protein PR016_18750 [Rhizobium tumorigenes]
MRRTGEERAIRVGQLADLDRRTLSARVSMRWGPSQHAVRWADGIVAHSTAGHGGFAPSPERNRLDSFRFARRAWFYEQDCARVAVVIALPDLFTAFEKRHVDDIFVQRLSASLGGSTRQISGAGADARQGPQPLRARQCRPLGGNFGHSAASPSGLRRMHRAIGPTAVDRTFHAGR